MHNQEKRFIFSINSGRAGSQYLSELLNTAPEVKSFHEPAPNMTGPYLDFISSAPYSASYSERKIKAQAILKEVSKAEFPEVYAETTHMFIKTFFDVLVDSLTNIAVIHLRRKMLSTLKSFVELGFFSSKNQVWPDWLVSPNAKTSAIECLAQDDKLDSIDLSIAYLIDTEARAQRFKLKYPHIPAHEIKLENLNRREDVMQLFDDLKITFTSATDEMLGKITNTRGDKKEKYNIQVEKGYLKKRIALYIEKYKALGLHLPQSLYL